jgi:hypothetical protein
MDEYFNYLENKAKNVFNQWLEEKYQKEMDHISLYFYYEYCSITELYGNYDINNSYIVGYDPF